MVTGSCVLLTGMDFIVQMDPNDFEPVKYKSSASFTALTGSEDDFLYLFSCSLQFLLYSNLIKDSRLGSEADYGE